MSLHKFYMTVKPLVDRIFIHQLMPNNTLKYINEMTCADPESAEDFQNERIFNGSIPMIFEKEKLILRLVGLEGEATYKFNDLFSIPLTKECLEEMFKQKENIQKNSVIINTPKEIEFVVVEIPKKLQQILKLSSIIFMADAEKNKINLFPEKTSVADKLARGVDPQGKTYVKFVDLDLSYVLDQRLITESLELINNLEFTIKCYRWHMLKEFSFESK